MAQYQHADARKGIIDHIIIYLSRRDKVFLKSMLINHITVLAIIASNLKTSHKYQYKAALYIIMYIVPDRKWTCYKHKHVNNLR